MNGLCVWTLKNGHGKTQREAMGRSRDAEEKKSDPVTVTVGERLMDPPTHRWTGFSHQMRPGLSALAFHRNLLTSSGLVSMPFMLPSVFSLVSDTQWSSSSFTATVAVVKKLP